MSHFLVLFDEDGCTAVVNKNRLLTLDREVTCASTGYIKSGGKRLLVEILEISGKSY